MWLSKLNTKEKMDDGSERVVPARTPFLSEAMLSSPNLKLWAEYVADDSEAAAKGREYLKSIEVEKEESKDVIDAEFEETEEVENEEVIYEEKAEPTKEADSEETEEIEKEETEEIDMSKYDGMKNNELKALLKEAKVEYKNSMNSTMLKTLCAENNL